MDTRCRALSAMSIRFLFTLSLIFTASSLAAPVHAMECVNYDDYLQESASEFINGRGKEIVVQDDIAYVGTHMRLQILDVSDPDDLVEIATVEGPGSDYVSLHGDLATVSYNGVPYYESVSGFKIIDVGDPASPVVLSAIETYPVLLGPSVRIGNHLLISADEDLRIYDVADPAAPVYLGVAAGVGAFNEIVVDGDYAYATGQQNLRVLDVSNPAAPSLVTTFPTTEQTLALALDGDRLAMSGAVGNEGTLRLFDVSTPTAPTELGQLTRSYWRCEGIELVGDLAYLTDGSLDVCDLSTPSSPRLLGSVTFARTTVKLDRNGDRLFLTAIRGSELYSTSVVYSVIISPEGIVPTIETEVDLPIEETAVAGDHAYLAAGDEDLVILDMSDPASPVTLAQLALPGTAVAIEVRGDIAYIAAEDGGLQIVSVTDPALPVLLAELALTHDADDLELSDVDDVLFVVTTYSGMTSAIDISDPAAPFLRSTQDLGGTPPVALSGTTLYMSGSQRAHINDVSDPNAMIYVGEFDYGEMSSRMTFFADDHLIVAYTWSWSDLCSSGFGIFDISDPLAPVLLDSVSLPSCSFGDLVATDNTIYVSSGNIQVYDYLIPTELRHLTQFGYSSSMLAAGNGMLLTYSHDRLAVAPLHCDTYTGVPDDGAAPANFHLSCVPNPFNPKTLIRFEQPLAGPAQLAVYGLDGRLVRTLLDRNLPAGIHEEYWNGLDDAGRSQSSGVYLLRYEGPGVLGKEKLVLIR